MGKVVEELDELREAMTGPRDREAVEAELGDLLFSCVNLARHLGIDADGALRRANLKFEIGFETWKNAASTVSAHWKDARWKNWTCSGIRRRHDVPRCCG